MHAIKIYTIKIILLNILILFFISVGKAQQKKENEVQLTPQLLDTLRFEGNYENSDLSIYDEAGYERVYRINTPLGKFRPYDINITFDKNGELKRPKCTIDKTYKFRIGGFKTGSIFSPDEIGEIFSQNHVLYTDGPGNDLLESLMICKKYSLQHYFYAPDFYDLVSSTGWLVGSANMKILSKSNSSVVSMPSSMQPIISTNHDLDLPFLDSSTRKYEKAFHSELNYMKLRLKDFSKLFPEAGGLFKKNFYNDSNMMWLLFAGGDLTPIDFFWNNVKQNYFAVNKEFKEKYGFSLPLMLKPQTPIEKAHRIIFWNWVREKFTSVMKLRSNIFRKEISGKGILASNVHFDTQVDFPLYGAAFDYPGFAIRPQMCDNKLDWQYLVGYGTRLTADLCKKLPMISVRTNLAAAGSRIVPTPKTIEYWYSQAIQNGCIGFYLWEQDFPSYKGAYSGPDIGNPDSSSLPSERWNTDLEMSKKLSTTKIFTPPKSETAILVSLNACALGNYGWKKVFSSYIELSKAHIWCNFISDQAIKEGIDSLSEYKVVYIPFMNFEDKYVVGKILEFVKEGGIVISGDPDIFSYDLKGNNIESFRKELFGISSIKKIKSHSTAVFNKNYKEIILESYSNSEFELISDNSNNVIAKYSNGNTAVTLKDYGRGKAIFFGLPIFDIYLYSESPGFKENKDRYTFFKLIAQEAKTRDLSWIWDVNVNNIKDVTGTITTPIQSPIKSIKFRRYLR